jgi:hypothetical protein
LLRVRWQQSPASKGFPDNQKRSDAAIEQTAQRKRGEALRMNTYARAAGWLRALIKLAATFTFSRLHAIARQALLCRNTT